MGEVAGMAGRRRATGSGRTARMGGRLGVVAVACTVKGAGISCAVGTRVA